MIRVGTALACVLALAGCMAGHETETPSTGATDQALAAAGSGGSDVKSDCAPSADKPEKPAVPVEGDCFEEMKRCVEKGDTLECESIVKRCSASAPPDGAQKPGKVPPPPLDDYMNCLIKSKECYASMTDLTVCDEQLKACEALKPEPANDTQAADDAYAACQVKIKECYASEPDTSICDAERKKCESLLEPEPK